MAEQRDTQLLRLHRRRLDTWGIAQGSADDPIIRPTDYERAVIDEAERILDGTLYADSHPHAQREMGMCQACDAAAIAEAFRDSASDEKQ